jgi:hypothetical protein
MQTAFILFAYENSQLMDVVHVSRGDPLGREFHFQLYGMTAEFHVEVNMLFSRFAGTKSMHTSEKRLCNGGNNL